VTSPEEDRRCQIAWTGDSALVEDGRLMPHDSLWEEPERAPSLSWSLDIPGLDPSLFGV
jgi:hypothetical protein